MGEGMPRRQAAVKDVSSAVATLRAIKSPGELALLTKALRFHRRAFRRHEDDAFQAS